MEVEECQEGIFSVVTFVSQLVPDCMKRKSGAQSVAVADLIPTQQKSHLGVNEMLHANNCLIKTKCFFSAAQHR